MDVSFLITLVILLIVFYFIFHLLKSILHTVILALVLFCVVLAAAGYLFIGDVRELRENFTNSTKLMLLADKDKIIFALEVQSLDMNNSKIVSGATLAEWQRPYQKKNYREILGTRYRLFLLKTEVFGGNATTVEEFRDNLKGVMKESKILFLLKEYNKGNLVIYPETPVFKLVRYLPQKWVDKVASWVD